MKKVYIQPCIDIKEFYLENIIATSSNAPVKVSKSFDLSDDSAWVTDDSVVDFEF